MQKAQNLPPSATSCCSQRSTQISISAAAAAFKKTLEVEGVGSGRTTSQSTTSSSAALQITGRTVPPSSRRSPTHRDGFISGQSPPPPPPYTLPTTATRHCNWLISLILKLKGRRLINRHNDVFCWQTFNFSQREAGD